MLKQAFEKGISDGAAKFALDAGTVQELLGLLGRHVAPGVAMGALSAGEGHRGRGALLGGLGGVLGSAGTTLGLSPMMGPTSAFERGGPIGSAVGGGLAGLLAR